MPAKKMTPARRIAAKKATAKKSAPAAKKAGAAKAPGRTRAARNDASMTSMQDTIEKAFKLPPGSVQLVGPGNRKQDESVTVGDLREKWAKWSQKRR